MRFFQSRLLFVAVAFFVLSVVVAKAFEAPIYPKSELAYMQQRYPAGVQSNFRGVVIPRLTSDERAALKDVRFVFPLLVKSAEPFGYYADFDSKKIAISINSLKFYDDISIASAWLNRNGYSPESIINYMLLLRYWPKNSAPPLPLDVLCIPKDALSNKDVDSLAQKHLATAVYYIISHELGHILHKDRGYQGISREDARKAEEKADAFALDLLARTGDFPGGVVMLLTGMAAAFENHSEYRSGKQYLTDLENRTHPLSTERLAAFAGALSESADQYAKSGLSSLTIQMMSIQILSVVGNMLETNSLTSISGKTLRPEDLGPMKSGDKLGQSCGKTFEDTPYSGRFSAKTTVNTVEFDAQLEMRSKNDQVTGKFSYGLGVGRFSGTLIGNQLKFDWQLGDDRGRGLLNYVGGNYVGTWGKENSATNGGAWNISGN